MKTWILTVLIVLAASLADAQLAPDLARLKQQFDADSAVALKPLVLRYAAQLEAAHRAALQRGDAATATAAEAALNDLRSKTTVPIPAFPAVAAAPGSTPPPATLDELRSRMGGTKWTGDDGGHMTFSADKSITTSWGTHGEWKIETPHRMIIEWVKGKRQEVALELDRKTFTTPNGVKWHLNE
jgi:hypothetical protein